MFRHEYNFCLSPDILSGRNDVTSGNVNFKPDISQNICFEKKSEHQEFVWLLKQFGATKPW